jgi:hypothetical protein
MAITIALLIGFAVPVVTAVACVVIARHLYLPGSRLWAGFAGVVGAIGIPVLVVLAIRDTPDIHERMAGTVGPIVALVLFAASSLIAPGVLLWFRHKK